MTDLTELARDRNCEVRIPGICNRRTDTTVAAHYSLATFSGKALKSPMWMIAFACSDCHDYVDGRRRSANFTKDQVRLMHAEGVFRTQRILLNEGQLQVAA